MAPMTATGTGDRLLALRLLGDAAQRLTRTVDGFHGDDWASPSLLSGWTRAHVVAHLALNAEAMARLVHAVVADSPSDAMPAMYDSDAQREGDIQELARADPSEIRERLLGGTTVLHQAFTAVPEDTWSTRVERTPGGLSLRVSSLPSMRVREVEVHHVDLGVGYTTRRWPPSFSVLLVDAMTRRLEPPHRFEIRPLDADRTWVLGPGSDGDRDGAVVTGPVADLGWWLTGRPAPETLSCSRGELPEIGDW
jgi:maleylpyruvate isomerase